MTRKVMIVALLLGCVASLVWMFCARDTSDDLVVNAGVVGGIMAVAALAVTVVLLWSGQPPSGADGEAGRLEAAAEYLARETLEYWRRQAKARHITTPSPAAARWCWAGPEVAAPPGEVAPGVFTEGVVTRLREGLYQPVQGSGPQRIVVLGGPGAGKTTAMLLLLVDILANREEGQPVPAWLTLGGWNPETTGLRDWAAATLVRDYPGLAVPANGGRDSVWALLRTSRVALFLDGLDEMVDDLRIAALRRIDEESQGMRVVLTSRSEEFDRAVPEQRLWGAAVVEVLPVEPERARDFLLAEQVADRRLAWRPVTDQLSDYPEGVVARTLISPLALSLARDAYANADPAAMVDIEAFPTPEALLRHLFFQSVVIAYPDLGEREHTVRWLSWVARRMGATRDLCWWDIPLWMAGSRGNLRDTVKLAYALTGGTLAAVSGGIHGGLVSGFMLGLASCFVFMFTPGLEGGVYRDEPHAFEVRLPRSADFLFVAGCVVGGCLFGLPFGLLFGLASELVLGLVGGLVVGVLHTWTQPLKLSKVVNPTESHRTDLTRFFAFGLVSGLAFGLAFGLVFRLVFGLVLALVLGVLSGLLGGLVSGLGPAGKLDLMILVWWFSGRRVRFMRLLQIASERQVLRQVGSVYQFRHAMLQDLLAKPSGVFLSGYGAAGRPRWRVRRQWRRARG